MSMEISYGFIEVVEYVVIEAINKEGKWIS